LGGLGWWMLFAGRCVSLVDAFCRLMCFTGRCVLQMIEIGRLDWFDN
jgi:hypothetical protein